MPTKSSLGKGLGAMFPDLLDRLSDKNALITCGIEELFPNRYQSRKVFDRKELADLVASVKESGIIQPIVARKSEGGYEIIAGERRWRAAQEAGLKEVPVVLRDAGDVDAALISVVENLLRTDLNPVEEAEAYQKIMKTFSLSQEEVSVRVGKDRSTVANMVRLLRLPADIRASLVERKITSGHARALLALTSEAEQMQIFRKIVQKGLNVRETEALIKRLKKTGPAAGKTKKPIEINDVENNLSRKLMTRVFIKQSGEGGVIEIRYVSEKDLDRLIRLLLGD
jgi:ParB family chromosome partitioning protein